MGNYPGLSAIRIPLTDGIHEPGVFVELVRTHDCRHRVCAGVEVVCEVGEKDKRMDRA